MEESEARYREITNNWPNVLGLMISLRQIRSENAFEAYLFNIGKHQEAGK